MTLAVTSRAAVRYIDEAAAFGVIPVAGNPNNLRFTGESLDFSITYEKSKEIRSDRQITDLAPVGASANGGVNFELSYNEYDDFMESQLQGTWSVYGTAGVGTAFSATYTATTITAAVAPTTTSAFTNLAKGQWFRLTSPTNPNDGKLFRVSESVSPTTTVITLSALTPATGTASGVTGTLVATSRLTNGVTQRSFTIEREFNDIAQFFQFRGMTSHKMTLSFQSGQIVTGSFDFMGKDSLRAGATAMPGVPIASTTFDVANAVSGVGNIYENGAALANTFIKSLTLDVDNVLRGRTGIGTLGNVSVGAGTLQVMGAMEVYLADGALYDKFVASTASSLVLRVSDSANNGYVITLPKIKYKDAKVNAGAIDQDAMISLPFEGLMDVTTGKMILIDRFGVAVV